MPTPRLNPEERPQVDVARADTYSAGTPVWVHRGGSWRPGCVLASSQLAAMVRYRPTDDRGTAVDTVRADHLLGRDDIDQMDRPIPWKSGQDVQLREQAMAGGGR